MDEIIAAIKAHALDNYNTDGWDFVVETMDSDDIKDILEHPLTQEPPVLTIEEGISAVGYIAKLLDDRRRDIQATAW